MSAFSIRPAVPEDAAAIVAILRGIAAERIYTAIANPWPAEEQTAYMRGLSEREVIHIAQDDGGNIIGYQVLDRWAPSLRSMAHVGQLGTFLRPEWRRRGVGAALFARTVDFARKSGYAKFVIQVRASNSSGLAFYRRLGFVECGRLHRQVRIDGAEDDEVLMEFFL